MKQHNDKPNMGFHLALPFLITLGTLTVVSFLIFLRPTQSYMEKRELAKFPEFTWEALASGDYFDDITLWFSDTFPGRESWMQLSTFISSFHGHSEIAIQGNAPQMAAPPAAPTQPTTETPPPVMDAGTNPAADTPLSTEVPASEAPIESEAEEVTAPEANEFNEIYFGQMLQINDTAYNTLAFDQGASDAYCRVISNYAESIADTGIRVISMPIPTAAGIMLDDKLREQVGCADQEMIVDYLNAHMSDQIITVDCFDNLMNHRDEYLYFRTDHHWTALGAYYAYESFCEAAGLTAAPLDSFGTLDQGEFIGSLYWKVPWPYKLTKDNVISYIPKDNIKMEVINEFDYSYEMEFIRDMREKDPTTKYLAPLAGGKALVVVTNNDLPDGPTCLLLMDSFANCFVPFMTQNYHKIICVDYRIFYRTLPQHLEKYEGVSDIIFMTNLIATQAYEGVGYYRALCPETN